jgi:hypothetical protein
MVRWVDIGLSSRNLDGSKRVVIHALITTTRTRPMLGLLAPGTRSDMVRAISDPEGKDHDLCQRSIDELWRTELI